MVNERAEYFPASEIVAEVARCLAGHEPGAIDWITFVGSGEPLLHSKLGSMIRQVKELTETPVAVITNGSLLYRADVRAELAPADAVLPTVDAGARDLYRRINRPHPDFTFEGLVDGLVAFRDDYRGKLWPEVMLVAGLNDSEAALRAIAATLARIRPDEIHVNLPTRPPAEPWLPEPASEALMRAVAIFEQVAPVRTAESPNGSFDLAAHDSVTDALIDIITRHPVREEELLGALAQAVPGQLKEALARLEADGRAQVVTRYGKRFWIAAAAHFPDRPSALASRRPEPRCRPPNRGGPKK